VLKGSETRETYRADNLARLVDDGDCLHERHLGGSIGVILEFKVSFRS